MREIACAIVYRGMLWLCPLLSPVVAAARGVRGRNTPASKSAGKYIDVRRPSFRAPERRVCAGGGGRRGVGEGIEMSLSAPFFCTVAILGRWQGGNGRSSARCQARQGHAAAQSRGALHGAGHQQSRSVPDANCAPLVNGPPSVPTCGKWRLRRDRVYSSGRVGSARLAACVCPLRLLWALLCRLTGPHSVRATGVAIGE